jgi:FMN phosphatase YigB (HAD superfamily)
MSETYSFDVFDTCLTRRYACPSDVFLEIAKCWKDILEPILGADFVEIFREARVEAERIALAKSTTEETTLHAIWEELARIFPAINPLEGVLRELSAEADALVAVSETHALVTHARSKGKRIAFISDTYLPSGFIRDQLALAGFLRVGDVCFVSSEIGKTKRQKTLYTHVLRELAITPSELHHHGDHPQSDVAIPRKLGIHAHLIRSAELNLPERNLAKSLPPTSDAWASRLVGEMRAFRANSGSTDLSAAITSLTAGLIGPVLAAMAVWVLRKAERDGVQRLYFFSRDGYALHRVASEMADHLRLPIQCRYLQVSRQALLLPSTSVISPDGMPWLRRHFEVPKIKFLAGKLDIPIELLMQELHDLVGTEGADFVIKNEEQWAIFWKSVSQGKLATLLQMKIEQRRKMLLEYLRQEGLFEGPYMGCVDLGWFQSCQAALIEVCQSVNPSFELKGYYLTLAHGRGAYLKKSTGQAMIHQAPYDRAALGQELTTLHNATLLEHLLSCAPHGTVHHYEAGRCTDNQNESFDIVPFCGQTYAEEQRIKKELADSTLMFANSNRWLATLPTDSLIEIVSSALTAAIETPEACWFKVAEKLTVSADQNNHSSQPIVRKINFSDAVFAIVRFRHFTDLGINKRGIWHQLTWSAMTGKLRIFYRVSGKLKNIKYKLKLGFRF